VYARPDCGAGANAGGEGIDCPAADADSVDGISMRRTALPRRIADRPYPIANAITRARSLNVIQQPARSRLEPLCRDALIEYLVLKFIAFSKMDAERT
jgi:hypothetical protein